MKTMPTIEELFEVYYMTNAACGSDFQEQRTPFFCGFAACLRAVDALSEVAWENEDEGDLAWQRLQAEFDKFATGKNLGESSINH